MKILLTDEEARLCIPALDYLARITAKSSIDNFSKKLFLLKDKIRNQIDPTEEPILEALYDTAEEANMAVQEIKLKKVKPS